LGYYWFADRFGWTKQQVDTQPVLHLRRLMTIGDASAEVQREQQERERQQVRG
jgi:hypothetical protein